MQPEAPRAGHRGLRERYRQRAAAEALVVHHEAGLLDAIRARDDQRRRHGGGLAELIANERGDVDFVTAAIDAALGIDVGVDGAGRIAPLYATVR